jgi:hypothetical protein
VSVGILDDSANVDQTGDYGDEGRMTRDQTDM